MNKQSCVYILKGTRFYVGCTENLQRRLLCHQNGGCHTTKRIGDWELVKVIETKTITEARKLEKNIKNSLSF